MSAVIQNRMKIHEEEIKEKQKRELQLKHEQKHSLKMKMNLVMSSHSSL